MLHIKSTDFLHHVKTTVRMFEQNKYFFRFKENYALLQTILIRELAREILSCFGFILAPYHL